MCMNPYRSLEDLKGYEDFIVEEKKYNLKLPYPQKYERVF